MKTIINKFTILMSLMVLFSSGLIYAQQPEIDNSRYNDKRGINVFEAPKTDVTFDGLKFRVGGDFTLQFQGLSQSNDGVGDNLVAIQNNFSLPTANLNFDVQLADGVRMYLRTYLSSRNHADKWTNSILSKRVF